MRRRLHRPGRRDDVVVRVRGADWLEELLGPTVHLTTREPRRDGCPVIEVEPDDVTPFLQPRLANPVRRWRPIGAPDEFEARHRDAALDDISRVASVAELGGWLDATRTGHLAYRRAHAVTADDVIDVQLRRHGLRPAPRRTDVSVVCVTMRPHRLEDVLANYDRQRHPEKELVLVTNSDGFDHAALGERLAGRDDVRVTRTPSSMSLGACLNLGFELASSRFVAKFDDDDEYGPHFLGDALLAHRYARAGVVGKHSYFAHLESDDLTVLRFPGGEFRYTPYLAGGTLVVDRTVAGGIRFPDVSVGEDQAFIASCHRRGIATFAADRFNFVQGRTSDNTWRPSKEYYLSTCVAVGTGSRPGLVHA